MSAQTGKGRTTELAALADSRPAVLPFLPTLVTAAVAAAFSLLCHQMPGAPQTPDVTRSAEADLLSLGAIGLHRPPNAAGAASAIPATLAFGSLYPLEVGAQKTSTVADRPAPVQTASTSVKRTCNAGRCPEIKRSEPVRAAATPAPSDPFAAARPLPYPAEADQAPDGVLRFLPQARAALETVRSIGDSTVALGTATIGSVLELR